MKPNALRVCAAAVLAAALFPALAWADPPEGHVTIQSEPVAVAAAPVKVAPAHPFAVMAGSWSGGGTIDLTNDIHEKLRCRAHHTYGAANNSLALSIRCASDNYKFELTSNVVDHHGQISGRWSETNYGVTGTIAGRVSGNHVSAVATGDKFTADLSVTTNGNHQSVTITPKKTYLQNVKIALSRAAAPTAKR
jgi:hypothetical protein